MTTEKQASKEMRAGWSRQGRTTNWGERKEGAARKNWQPRVYSSLSHEGNIMSLCLLSQQILKGKSSPSLHADSYRAQSTAATSQSASSCSRCQLCRFKGFSLTVHTHVLPHCKISGYSLYLFWKARKLHIQKLCQKYFKRLQTEATNCEEIPALGSLYTEKLSRSC